MSSGERSAVILGAGGTLGTALRAWLSDAGWRVVTATRGEGGDIRDAAAIGALVTRAQPDVVFNAAAYTDVDRAETEPELAEAVNADGAEVVARAADAVGAKVVHYSTDFVFDGELERLYDERDPTSPQGCYARSKVAGDTRVAAAAPRHFILRVGCLYGHGGRNFPSTIVRRLRAGETVRAVDDRWGSPTWVREVARVSEALARTDFYGLYHCTSQGETTWADFARLAAQILGVPAERAQGVASASLPLKAARPRRSILDNRALRARGLDTLSSWQDALRAFIAEELARA
ncbi:MAG TPA: dTDP-4-dehydrorhamnose reductase [Polyangia bacterium]|nr:dTDP-4-dehydrorhamnose reductase [Polyangia bacterium]